MIAYFIENIEKAKRLAEICDKYKNTEIDVLYGRQVIDGKSILGVMSLMGKMVSLKFNSVDKNDKKKFEEEINNEI